MVTAITPPDVRFWRHVNQEGPGGCWEWTAARSYKGYGVFNVRVRVNVREQVPAHRFAYELLVGSIAAGLQLDHLCRNRACVNPAHLEAVTQHENLMRGEGITARFARATHCINGHPFEGRNLIARPGGGRSCRACSTTRTQLRRAHKRLGTVAA